MENRQEVAKQEVIKRTFLSECSIKRLGAIVGENNSAKFLSDFVTLAEQMPKADLNQVARCCIEIASMKLPILKQAGQAYLVPRGGVYNVEIGYKGWIVLAKRAGFAVRVYPLFQGDDWTYSINGFSQNFSYTPAETNLLAEKTEAFVEQNLKAIAVVTKDLTTNIEACEIVEMALLKKLRSKSNTKDGGVYKEWLLEMYKAKATKYVLKRLPLDTLDTSIFKAFESDDKNDVSFKEAPQTQKPMVKALESNPYVSASDVELEPTEEVPVLEIE